MAMGTRKPVQAFTFVAVVDLPEAPTVPFYEQLNEVLDEAGFDRFVEDTCSEYYHERLGRPSLPPGTYFRILLLGYLLGLTSERGIALSISDSLSIRAFLGLGLTDSAPDHSTISRTRQRIALEAHSDVFGWVLERLQEAGLAKGSTVGVDATTLQANASLSTLQRKDSGEDYEAFVLRLAEASGLKSPTREELIDFDRKRKPKKLSNEEWEHSVDPDARVGKMKNGGTDMCHKAEHAVDLESGALVGVTVQAADQGDTTTVVETLEATEQALGKAPETVVADKGYHSGATVQRLEENGQEAVIPEPKRAERKWKDGQEAERAAVESTRERVASEAGRDLLRQRAEKVERSMAHMYETGGLRRVYLRGHNNILKRLLVHACGFNLGVLMRARTGVGTPRSLQGQRTASVLARKSVQNALLGALERLLRACGGLSARFRLRREWGAGLSEA